MIVPESFQTRGPAATAALGRRLARRLRRGDCVALIGELGAGKTVLVHGLAGGLGLADGRLVSSPSYVLVQEYPADVTVYHLDLYRLADPSAELADLGLDEMLGDGIALIEWADRAADALPIPHWEIRIDITGANKRTFTVRRVGAEVRGERLE